MEAGPTIGVVVTDTSRMGCQLMAAAFRRSRHRLVVLGWAIDSAGVRAELSEHQPDVAIISARLKDGPIAGFQLTRELRAARSKTKVVMLLDSCERLMVIEAFRTGAHGIFSREDSFDGLCKCICAVHEGQIWADSTQLHFIVEALAETAPVPLLNAKGQNLLTKREEGVVYLVAEGRSNRDISHQLKLSEHTVRNYLFRIFNKLGTSNRLELALYAIKQKEASATYAQQGPFPHEAVGDARRKA